VSGVETEKELAATAELSLQIAQKKIHSCDPHSPVPVTLKQTENAVIQSNFRSKSGRAQMA